MRRLLIFLEQMEDEADGAVEYARCSARNSEAKELSDMYAAMAKTEMDHYSKLRAQAAKCVSECGDGAEEIFEWQCERLMRRITEAKSTLEMGR